MSCHALGISNWSKTGVIILPSCVNIILFATLHQRNITPSVIILELKIGTSMVTVDSMTTGFKTQNWKNAHKMVALIASERRIWVFFRKNIPIGSTFSTQGG